MPRPARSSLRLAALLLCGTLFALGVPARAQDEAGLVRIVLQDGSELVGTILSETADEVRFRMTSGAELTLRRDQIRAITPLSGRVEEGTYYRVDPNRTRLFFAPTARALASGEGYISLYELFFPFVAYGAGDRVVLSGGVSLIPGLGLDNQAYYVAPKATLLNTGSLSVAVGGLLATVPDAEGTGGMLFGLGTLGQPERALTLGVGFAFGGGEFEETPVILIGGEYQLSNSVKLLSENYVIPALDNVAIVSGGIRFFSERLAADFGLFTSPEAIGEMAFPFFPWVGFSYNFGR